MPLLELIKGDTLKNGRRRYSLVTVVCFGDLEARAASFKENEQHAVVSLPAALAAKWTSQILDALSHLESVEIIHRENLAILE